MPEERPVTTKEELLDQICGLLGGRAAEELFTGYICTGASNDLERVTKMVYGMISIYGMGERMPNVNYYNFSENSFSRPYSEATAQMIDEEVKDLIQVQYERAKNVLTQHSQGLKELAQLLIDKEVIYPADLERIFGPRQWRSRSDEIMELNQNMTDDINSDSENGPIDFADENAEIIRQKALKAVVEKQKRVQEQKLKEQQQMMEEQRKLEEKEKRERLRKEEMRRQEETRKLAEQRRQEDMRRREEDRRRKELEELEKTKDNETTKNDEDDIYEREAMELEYMNNLSTDDEMIDKQVEKEERVEDKDEKIIEENDNEKANPLVELSLFPEMNEDKETKMDNSVNDEELDSVNDEVEFEQPAVQDDYNPFLDSWSNFSDREDNETPANDEEKVDDTSMDLDMKKDVDDVAEINDEDDNHGQVNIEDFIKRDDNVLEKVADQEVNEIDVEEDGIDELEFELNDEPDEKLKELKQDLVDTDEIKDVETEDKVDTIMHSSKKDDKTIEVGLKEDVDDVVDVVENETADSDVIKENDRKVDEDKQDEEEDEGEEIIITSRRKRRNFNIEEVLPDNDDE